MERQHIATVQVTEPLMDATKSFVTYLVSGSDSLGSFQIRRRYNDFFYLREALRKRWPGLYVPPIPEKKINISGQDDQQIEYRRKFFDYFLKQLADIAYMFKCPITQQFLRNQSVVMEKYYQTVADPRTSDLISQYKLIFSGLKQKQSSGDHKNDCNNFASYLKRAEREIKVLSGELLAIVEARSSFIDSLNNCNTQMLPEYEKNVYSQYVADAKRDPMLLFVHDTQVQQNINNLKQSTTLKPNPFALFYDKLVYQGREIQAFQQAIQSKDEQQSNKRKLEQQRLESQSEVSKLQGGKFSFKSIFAKGNKNEQIQVLEKEIPEMKKQIQELAELCEIITCIQAVFLIPNFKNTKREQYYRILGQISHSELEYLGAYGEFMRSVMEGLTRVVEVNA